VEKSKSIEQLEKENKKLKKQNEKLIDLNKNMRKCLTNLLKK